MKIRTTTTIDVVLTLTRTYEVHDVASPLILTSGRTPDEVIKTDTDNITCRLMGHKDIEDVVIKRMSVVSATFEKIQE